MKDTNSFRKYFASVHLFCIVLYFSYAAGKKRLKADYIINKKGTNQSFYEIFNIRR